MANNINIKHIEDRLWKTACKLRSNSSITADEYVAPVLGIIFLKFAELRFNRAYAKLKEDKLKNPRNKNRENFGIAREDYANFHAIQLDDKAKFSFVANVKEGESMQKAVKEAMETIMKIKPELEGVLPVSQYDKIPEDILRELFKEFNTTDLDNVDEDVIGRIYEFFISEFSKEGSQDSGMFFTPKSLVELISQIIEPDHGTILDPACGSGGMLIQAFKYCIAQGAEQDDSAYYGHEFKDTTANLCLMNMAVHGIDAKIKTGAEANSYYNDPHDLFGKCDFVMANPPFNDSYCTASKMPKDSETSRDRRLPLGTPTISKEGSINNCNYLWLQYFYSYLNENGRAGFVIASSASDASSANELGIRNKIINADAVEVIVAVADNFFYTKSLPCQLWFYNKNKSENCKGKTLFIDAKSYFTKVDSSLNEWNKWQSKNLTAIVHLYRGETDKYIELLNKYDHRISAVYSKISSLIADIRQLDVFNIIEQKDVVIAIAEIKARKPDTRAVAMRESIGQAMELMNSFKDAVYSRIQSKNKEEKEKSIKAFADVIEMPEVDGKKKKIGFKDISKVVSEKFSNLDDLLIDFSQLCDGLIWLYSKFGDGQYVDVKGICKVVSISEMVAKNCSLTPGVYVGVAEKQKSENALDFDTEIRNIHQRLRTLHTEANEIMKKIDSNFEEFIH